MSVSGKSEIEMKQPLVTAEIKCSDEEKVCYRRDCIARDEFALRASNNSFEPSTPILFPVSSEMK